ncbi:nicotinate phosphoribosyltransferase [Modicisalibacter muralis]|uniref:Nicotinate phosphoribosyltransferase n=1 Tax=Modicisalibacter muralis TaxID=119000 RepID=A0A1G9GS02_9GAMM|nr:nicotinate phosphoribosyltransferase [Halomonas muralis]SDL03470.1 nicotinate phosphoribosyltransferase [Halomonas muralis]
MSHAMRGKELPDEEDLGLLTDLYELTMIQAYWAKGMHDTATFSLFFRKLPAHRNFMLACGQQYAAHLVTKLHFGERQIDKLRRLDMFDNDFLDWLAHFRFTGSIHALPEGTPIFPHEPLLEVEAPIAEAQLLESLLMNYVHLETVLASKASRLVLAAEGRPVVDFGMRRMHGIDAAVRGVRAYRVAGLAGTSNVLGALTHDLPANGTMAHSFIQAHDNEDDALLGFARQYPGTTLLVDTYDTVEAVKRLIAAIEREPTLDIGAIRLDSGDMGKLARQCRQLLDDAGHEHIRITASGGLDEYRIQQLLAGGAPIDGFGVGTALGAASDAPCLELAYKLTEYAGKPRLKHSPGKHSLPGRKQIYRERRSTGEFMGDHLTLRDESAPGTPLLAAIVNDGVFLPEALGSPDQARDASRDAVASLPAALRGLDSAPAYPVAISERIHERRREAEVRLELLSDG